MSVIKWVRSFSSNRRRCELEREGILQGAPPWETMYERSCVGREVRPWQGRVGRATTHLVSDLWRDGIVDEEANAGEELWVVLDSSLLRASPWRLGADFGEDHPEGV